MCWLKPLLSVLDFKIVGGILNEIVIIIGNRIDNLSSNPGQG